MAHVIIEDEQYIFRRETRNKLFFVLGLGVLLFVVGLITSSDLPALPLRAQRIKGVSPEGAAAFGFAPAASSRSTIAALALVQASDSGVAP